jgi:hypothetical protein
MARKEEFMRRWFEPLSFLWEQECAPPQERSTARDEQCAGVPPVLQRAVRLCFAGVVATGLMAQIIGVRLIAPVDAAPTYAQQCKKTCNDQHSSCLNGCNGLTGQARATCNNQCNTAHQECGNTCK